MLWDSNLRPDIYSCWSTICIARELHNLIEQICSMYNDIFTLCAPSLPIPPFPGNCLCDLHDFSAPSSAQILILPWTICIVSVLIPSASFQARLEYLAWLSIIWRGNSILPSGQETICSLLLWKVKPHSSYFVCASFKMLLQGYVSYFFKFN